MKKSAVGGVVAEVAVTMIEKGKPALSERRHKRVRMRFNKPLQNATPLYADALTRTPQMPSCA
jgi:hypothetical protein